MSRSIALTLGEPAGIGPDLTIALWRRRLEFDLPPFYVIADRAFLARRAKLYRADRAVSRQATPREAGAVFASALPVVDVGTAGDRPTPGRPDAASAPAAITSIRLGVRHVLAGDGAEAIVTNLVAKNVLYRSGFVEPGHTEFLAKLTAEATGKPVRPVMMLWSPELAVVPVTIHLPLAEVPAALDTDLVVETGRITARDLASRFRIANPRLAIAGLNPHAGEDGAMGAEDFAIVRPAVERLVTLGIAARGPLPADTMFHPAARATYDAALCMYHDQALSPIKTLAFDHAVNVTLGPAVRAHFARPRHRLRHRRHRPRRSRRALIAALRLAARLTARGAGRRSPHDGASTTCRRCATRSGVTAWRPVKHSARIFSSTSTSRRASPARAGRSTASRWWRSVLAPAGSPAHSSPRARGA